MSWLLSCLLPCQKQRDDYRSGISEEKRPYEGLPQAVRRISICLRFPVALNLALNRVPNKGQCIRMLPSFIQRNVHGRNTDILSTKTFFKYFLLRINDKIDCFPQSTSVRPLAILNDCGIMENIPRNRLCGRLRNGQVRNICQTQLK